MKRNFDFLKDSAGCKTLYGFCRTAEEYQCSDPERSALAGRRALEWLVNTIYRLNEYEKGERWSLMQMVDDEQFVNFLGADAYDLRRRLHYIRKVGNSAAHLGSVSKKESFFSVLNLHHFAGAVLKKIGLIDDFPAFDSSLLPKKPEPMLIVEPKDTQPDDALISTLPKVETLGEVKATPCADLSEAETRKLFIDLMLKEAGWNVLEQNGATMPSCACVEVEVSGMPNGEGKGFADYVLFGANGKPLAVVEAKRTTADPIKGRHQAELYADCLDARYGVRPVIYYSNGYQTFILDGIYPPREVYGYHTEAELQLLIQKRDRNSINDLRINDDISNREYQKRAIKAVCEHFNAKHRKALLVMATGTGKTRTAISLVDVLTRNNWVKNVLFLADRTSLVSQAHKNFAKLLPQMTYCVLSDEGKNGDKDARVMLSTYQTMINYIDAEEKEFSVGRFDLIIIDEAHRSVFGKFGSIFSYFDAMLVGLTATPREGVDRSTYQLFELEEGEPNFAYELKEAQDDGYLTTFQPFNKGTAILREGIRYDDLSAAEKEQLEKVWEYESIVGESPVSKPRDIRDDEIFRYIFNEATIDKVLQDLMTNGLKVQDGERLGKTIIFAANHQHAELIVKRFGILYPEYGASFCQLIDNYVKYAHDLIDKFEQRTSLPQIAVSVDMLDVGIDVPDVLNLVFFKVVKSKIKFWQMVGRGTRLSENIFGEGQHKTCFHIYDWCGNFEYFNVVQNGAESKPAQSLTERLFCLKADIARELQKAQYQADDFAKNLHDSLKVELLQAVQALNDSRISVRENWKAVDRFRKQESWQCLSEVDVSDLKEAIAPIVLNSTDDIAAKRFDVLALLIELSLLDDTVKSTKAQTKTITIVHELQGMASIPQVMGKMDMINEVLAPAFWENLTLGSLERMRTGLREIVKFLERDGKTFVTNIDDTLIDDGRIDVRITPMTYKERVIDYLKTHKDLPVLEKITHVRQLTHEDIAELERILWSELGSKDEYEKLAAKVQCGDEVGVFIRSIIGIDRAEAERLFSGLISSTRLNSMQEEYLKTIITYVCANGDIDNNILINRHPFSEYNWLDTFGSDVQAVAEYVNRLHAAIRAA